MSYIEIFFFIKPEKRKLDSVPCKKQSLPFPSLHLSPANFRPMPGLSSTHVTGRPGEKGQRSPRWACSRPYSASGTGLSSPQREAAFGSWGLRSLRELLQCPPKPLGFLHSSIYDLMNTPLGGVSFVPVFCIFPHGNTPPTPNFPEPGLCDWKQMTLCGSRHATAEFQGQRSLIPVPTQEWGSSVLPKGS